MTSSCSVCGDNFIVNTKLIQCNFCGAEQHLQCAKLKDNLFKTISESRNLQFFCDVCLTEVQSKLRQSSSSKDDVEMESDSLCREQNAQTKAITEAIEKSFVQLKNEISSLKESNIELIKLMSSSEFAETRGNRSKTRRDIQKQDDGEIVLVQRDERGHIVANNKNRKEHFKRRDYAEILEGKEKINDQSTLDSNKQRRKEFIAKEVINPIREKREEGLKGKGRPNNLLQPAPRGRNWIWLGGLQSDTTTENIKTYAEEKWPNKDILCFDLKSRGPKKAFKFGSSDLSLEELLHLESWPAGIGVRLFRNEH